MYKLLAHCSILILLITLQKEAKSQNRPVRDRSVGENGAAWINVQDSASPISAIFDFDIDPAGYIYLVGGANPAYSENFITKITPAGKLDSTFKEKGFREVGFGPGSYISQSPIDYHDAQFIRINSDQSKIWVFSGSSILPFRSARFSPNGNLDSSYGQKGYKIKTDLPPMSIRDIVMTADKGFILTGIRGFATTHNDTLQILKFTADGELDSVYNKGNPVVTSFGGLLKHSQTILKTDGSLIVTVEFLSGLIDSIAVCSISALGLFDSTFGTKGIAKSTLGNLDRTTTKTILLKNGGITTFTFWGNPAGNVIQQKLTAAGQPDTTVNKTGRIIVQIGNCPQYIFNRTKDPYDLHIWGYRPPFIQPDSGEYVMLNLQPNGDPDLVAKVVNAVKVSAGPIIDNAVSNRPDADEYNFQFANHSFYLTSKPVNSKKDNASFKLIKLDEHLSLNPDYGVQGRALIGLNRSRDYASLVKPLASGGVICYAKTDGRMMAFKISRKGNIDRSFGKNGFIDSLVGDNFCIDRYDRMLFVGYNIGTSISTISRYNSNGWYDSTFGINGRKTFLLNEDGAVGSNSKVLIQSDNKILILFTALTNDRKADIVVARLNEDGTPDYNFGTNGRVYIDMVLDFIKPAPGVTYNLDDIAGNFLLLRDSSIVVEGSYLDKQGRFIFKLNKNGQIIRNGGENGRHNSNGSFDAKSFFMGETSAGQIIIVQQDGKKHTTGISTYNNDLTYSGYYGGYYSSELSYFESAVLLHNGEVILTGRRYNSVTEKFELLSIETKPGDYLDSTFAIDGILTYADLFPDTSTVSNPSGILDQAPLTAFSVEDADGQLVTITTAQRNYLQDIFYTRNLINDTLAVSPPQKPVIQANPSFNFCKGNAVTLLADAPGCVNCTYTWSNGFVGKSISVRQPGTYTVTVRNNSGLAVGSQIISETPAPKVKIISNVISTCAGTSVTLTASGASEYLWQGPSVNATSGTTIIATPLIDAVFKVTGTTNGCQNQDSIVIKVTAAVIPSVEITYTGCPTNSISFSANCVNCGSNPAFKWYVNNQYAKDGQQIVLSNLNNGGIISCNVKSNAACAVPDSAIATVIMDCISGSTSPIEGLDYFTIAPNPTRNSVTLNFKTNKQERITFIIRDSNGRIVFIDGKDYVVGGQSRTIDLEKELAGAYYLELTVGNTRFVRRILKVN